MKLKKIVNTVVVSTFIAVLMTTEPFALTNNSVMNAMPAELTYPEIPKTDRMIVKYRDGSTQAMTKAQAIDRTNSINFMTGTAFHFIRRTAGNADVLKLDESVSVKEMQAMAERISADPDVLYAEPDLIMQTYAIPDDPLYDAQWHYYENAGGIDLPDAWDISTGQNVVVAVIDTGILPHADLEGQILPGYDFITDSDRAGDGDGRDPDPVDPGNWWPQGTCSSTDPGRPKSNWHGTHVAGTVAARSNNNVGVSGVAWNAKILPVRALGKCGGYSSDIADAIRWSAGLSVMGVPKNQNPAKVLNLSVGGPGKCLQSFREAVEAVHTTGATVVVAAGNENDNASQYTPANCPGVITVAANNRDGGRAFYSNFGDAVDIIAPGGELEDPVRGLATPENGIASTLNSGATTAEQDNYVFSEGTSMAAPHVAGVAALLYALDPQLTPDEVVSILTRTARSFPAVAERPCDTASCGAGILDAWAAVNEIDKTTPEPGSNRLDNGVPIQHLSATQNGMIQYQMEVPAGATDLSFAISGGQGDADLYVKFGQAPTLDDFDYRPYQAGSTELVDVSPIQEGIYYIALYGYEAFSDVSLVGHYQTANRPSPTPQPQSKKFTNDTDMPIPDLNTQDFLTVVNGAISTIEVPISRDAGVITLDIDIKHRRSGELWVRLITPDGRTTTLKNIDILDDQANFQTTVNLDASGIEATGQWSLNIVDFFSANTGYIDRWSITFK